SQTLSAELEGTGVQVQVLCPGVVATEFHQRQGIDMSAVPRMSADDVVTASLRGLELGETVVAPGVEDAGLLQAVFDAEHAAFPAQSRQLAGGYRVDWSDSVTRLAVVAHGERGCRLLELACKTNRRHHSERQVQACSPCTARSDPTPSSRLWPSCWRTRRTTCSRRRSSRCRPRASSAGSASSCRPGSGWRRTSSFRNPTSWSPTRSPEHRASPRRKTRGRRADSSGRCWRSSTTA